MRTEDMKFYVAKAIITFKHKSGPEQYPMEAWEEIVIFNATDFKHAKIKGIEWALREAEVEMYPFSFLADGAPMKKEFEGLRELVTLPVSSTLECLGLGSIIAHSIFELNNQDEVSKFLADDFGSSFKYLGAESGLKIDYANFSDNLQNVLANAGDNDAEEQGVQLWRGVHLLYQIGAANQSIKSDRVLLLDLLILVRAASQKKALQVAAGLGKEYASLINVEADGKHAPLRYLGIRQNILVDNEEVGEDFSDLEPTDKTEVSYNKYLVDNAVEQKNLANGMDAVIRFAPAIGEGSGLIEGYDGQD